MHLIVTALLAGVLLSVLMAGCGDVTVNNGPTCTENSAYACPGQSGTTTK
jgi:hypothetical protein